MLKRCFSISFLSCFIITLFTAQKLYILSTSRIHKAEDIQRRKHTICGRKVCNNLIVKPVFTHFNDEYIKNDNFKKVNSKTNKYLLPVLFYNMGPNNLFRILKEAVSLTTLLNRTLVIPPFPHHPRMESIVYENEISDMLMKVDIFDQSYTSKVETEAKKIVDVEQLKELLSYVTFEKFKSVCGNKISTTLICGNILGKRVKGVQHFQQVTGIQLENTYTINQIQDEDLKTSLSLNLLNAIHSTEDEKCVALVLGHKCFGSRNAWLNFWTPQSKYFQRPTDIQDLATSFIKASFNNERYLSVHWRFENIDWLDMCKGSRPRSVRRINRPICELVKQIVHNETFLDEIAMKIEAYMEQQSLNYLYFAAPPQLNNALQHLQTKLRSMFYSDNVKKFAEKFSNLSHIFDNNFSASFLDQEICYRSSVFLGSPLSSWTQTVMLDRVSQGLFDYRSLFDVILKDSSRFPKLTWYFPEGN